MNPPGNPGAASADSLTAPSNAARIAQHLAAPNGPTTPLTPPGSPPSTPTDPACRRSPVSKLTLARPSRLGVPGESWSRCGGRSGRGTRRSAGRHGWALSGADRGRLTVERCGGRRGRFVGRRGWALRWTIRRDSMGAAATAAVAGVEPGAPAVLQAQRWSMISRAVSPAVESHAPGRSRVIGSASMPGCAAHTRRLCAAAAVRVAWPPTTRSSAAASDA